MNIRSILAAAIGVVFLSPTLWAEEESAISTSESAFHLLSFKCEPEAADTLDATPQSPPLDVDDPGTPGCNHWEINITSDADITRGMTLSETPLFDINYGIGDNLQLKFERPYETMQVDGASVSALGETKLGIKHMFLDSDELGLHAAIYPQVLFSNSGSDVVQKGMATPGSIVTLPLLVSTRVVKTKHGDIAATFNVGYNLSNKSDTTSFMHASAGLGVPLLNKLAVMGEFTTQQALKNDAFGVREELLKADVGVMGMVSRHFVFYVAGGHSLMTSDSDSHTYVLGGVQILTAGWGWGT